MKIFKKICTCIYILVIMSICTLPVIGMIMGLGSKSTENRTLSSMPELFDATEDSTKLNTEYTTELSDYFSENFGFRQELVTVNSLLHEKIFFQSSNEKVVMGKDGWYYFNETTDDYTGRSALSERGIYRLKKVLELINEYAKESNITLTFFSAPNKNSLYPDFMPMNIIKSNKKSNLDRLSEAVSESDYYIDMKYELQNLMSHEKNSIYLKHDSHWNNLGALAAFNSVENNLKSRIKNFDYKDYSDVADITEITCNGDLTDMLYPSLNKTDVQYDLGIPVEFSSEQPISNVMASEINTTCQGRYFTAICYRDSFFNSMINLTSNAFAKVRYTRTFPYDMTAAKSGKYNIAIVEIAERNLPTLLNEAPIMDAVRKSAPKLRKKISVEQPCEFSDDGDFLITKGKISVIVEQPCEFSDDGEYLIFKGKIGDWAKLDTESNIYIELCGSDGKSYYYEAFPILIGNAMGDNGFYVRITKYGLANDDYKAFIHVGDENSTIYASLKIN